MYAPGRALRAVVDCPGMGAPWFPYLPSNHSVSLHELMIRRSAVCVGSCPAAGEGFTTTPLPPLLLPELPLEDPLLEVVPLEDPLEVLEDPLLEVLPVETRFPLEQDCLLVS